MMNNKFYAYFYYYKKGCPSTVIPKIKNVWVE